MSTGSNMKEIKNEKWERTKRIKEFLRGSKTINEIAGLFYENPSNNEKRNIYNYLKQLMNLSEVEYNTKTKTYQKTGIRKRIFESKADLDQAVIHAKYLVLSDAEKGTQRYDYRYLTKSVVDLIIFYDKFNEMDSQLDKCVYQHIESDYYEIFKHLQKYKKLMIENGFPEKRLPKLTVKGFERPFLREGEELTEKEKEQEKTLQEIDALRGLIDGLIDRQIIYPVSEGQPLLGECEQCPHTRFHVKH